MQKGQASSNMPQKQSVNVKPSIQGFLTHGPSFKIYPGPPKKTAATPPNFASFRIQPVFGA
jgi:hypothetical protein